MVGTGRFELPTPRTPSECSTRLSHVPTRKDSAVCSGWGYPAILHQPITLAIRERENRASHLSVVLVLLMIILAFRDQKQDHDDRGRHAPANPRLQAFMREIERVYH